MTKRQKIEAALSERYKFRYNVITSTIEYMRLKEGIWRHHYDYDMNSIIREIDKEAGEAISPAMYTSIVGSDFSEQFHPIRDYFQKHLNNCELKEGSIKELAATVEMKDNQQQFAWNVSLKRWLVASVAQAHEERGCQNHTCIVFTGGMGKFKTTWLDNLCPPYLRPDYLFTGKIDLSPGNKDVQNMMVTKFIMNLDDQMRNLMKKDSETMKTMITQPELTIRRPYARFDQTYARLANFIASMNGDQFLAEDENRRFLPFQVMEIDINQAKDINMDYVWKEALNLYNTGFRYWWTKEELSEAFPNMNDFAFTTDEMNLIVGYYTIPEKPDEANLFVNATELVARIKSQTGVLTSSRKIGEALKTLGAIQKSIRNGRLVDKKYCLIDPNIAPTIEDFKKVKNPF